MATPTVPQRPARSQDISIPTVPARPRRTVERSVSPNRDSYAPSPLNDPAFFPPTKGPGASSLSRSIPKDHLQRPPSVSLPSVGQEGSEYAHLNDIENSTKAELTKTVSGELPLHAPKASLPAAAAKSRIQAVTRTDSDSAAALGIGKPSSEADKATGASGLGAEIYRTTSSHSRRSRPSSLYKVETNEEEHGIPEIGVQIPLYPNAGDVQAPTPGPTPSSKGGDYLIRGEGRHHSRTKSGREVFHGPPGSYGMHGHGIVNHTDPFEKDWYAKHPEASAREAKGQYGPKIPMERKEYNLSSAELNKLVHGNDSIENLHASTPDEQIGYLASEEYAHRISGSRPPSQAKRRSAQYADSPLRKQSLSGNETPNLEAGGDDDDDDDDDDDSEIIHVNPPHLNLPAEGGNPADGEHEDHEQPILAEDEVAKRPEGQYMSPAVPEREGSSRPHSRSNSFQSPSKPLLQRKSSSIDNRESAGTPLEGVKEYEPLFPEDENKPAKERKKHIDNARHHFPSKDVWEDTPDSVMYETTVATPQIEAAERREAENEPSGTFESSQAEESRKENLPAARNTLLNEEQLKTKPTPFSKDIKSEMQSNRPHMRHRFPSQDVWEDTPDSLMYTTTVTPEASESTEGVSPVDKKAPSIPSRPKPQVPARPSKLSSQGSTEDVPLAKSTSTEDEPQFPKQKPPVPSRPAGSKISALRGAFMSNLESRLQAGPQAVPKQQEEEVEEEKAPLQDARKGRARGPARRKPGVSPGAEKPKAPKVSFMSAVTIWEISEDGAVSVGNKSQETTKPLAAAVVEEKTNEVAVDETA